MGGFAHRLGGVACVGELGGSGPPDVDNGAVFAAPPDETHVNHWVSPFRCHAAIGFAAGIRVP